MTTIAEYLRGQIATAEVRVNAHTDMANNGVLPPESREYHTNRANEQITRAETLREVLRALDDGRIHL